MEYVEIRNQNRIEEIRKVRGFLLPGDQTKISKRCGKAIRTVNDTLNENHPLFSRMVISAAWDLIAEAGRIPEEDKPTADYIANL